MPSEHPTNFERAFAVCRALGLTDEEARIVARDTCHFLNSRTLAGTPRLQARDKAADLESLEAMVDAHGLAGVLRMLQDVCDLKIPAR